MVSQLYTKIKHHGTHAIQRLRAVTIAPAKSENVTENRGYLRLWASLTGAGAVLATVLTSQQSGLTATTRTALVTAFAPLIGTQLLLTWWPQRVPKFRPIHLPLAITTLFAIPAIASGSLNLLTFPAIAVGLSTLLLAIRKRQGKYGLQLLDVAVLLILWVPLDSRWTADWWPALPALQSFNFWAIAVSITALVGWGWLGRLPDFRTSLRPTPQALRVTAIYGGIGLLGVVGWWAGFGRDVTATMLATSAIRSWVVVALPEEIIFRGILQTTLDQSLNNPKLSLFLAAAIFGLTHWNNASTILEAIGFVAGTTVAGILLGDAYRRSGNHLLAPTLVHALADIPLLVIAGNL